MDSDFILALLPFAKIGLLGFYMILGIFTLLGIADEISKAVTLVAMTYGCG